MDFILVVGSMAMGLGLVGGMMIILMKLTPTEEEIEQTVLVVGKSEEFFFDIMPTLVQENYRFVLEFDDPEEFLSEFNYGDFFGLLIIDIKNDKDPAGLYEVHQNVQAWTPNIEIRHWLSPGRIESFNW